MAGLLLYSTQPVQQPNGLICNAWEASFGQCHPVWDNPQTYRSTLQIPLHMWDMGDSCLALPRNTPLTEPIPCVLKTYPAILVERCVDMSELSKYVESGDWYNLFDEGEVGHALIFLYNLIKWIERDKADLIELKSTEFAWSRNKKVIGIFPLTIPPPIPSFIDLLSEIFDKDPIIRKYFDIKYIDMGVFKISHK